MFIEIVLNNIEKFGRSVSERLRSLEVRNHTEIKIWVPLREVVRSSNLEDAVKLKCEFFRLGGAPDKKS